MRSWLAVCVIVLAACTDNTRVPKDIIQKDKMQKVLWDMLQADKFVTDFLPRPGDTAYNETEIFKVYQKVFNVHGITRDEFLKSYSFYLNHPDITKTLFDSISVQAERRRADIYKPKSKPADSLKRDSLRRPSVPDTLRKGRLDSIRRRLQKQ